MDIFFGPAQDGINFIQDYSYSMKNNKENRAITKMWSKGARGKLLANARVNYNAKVKKYNRTKGYRQFSNIA